MDSQVDGDGETVLEHRELPHLDAQRELQAMNAAAAAAIVKAKAEAVARAATPVKEEFMDPMEEEVVTHQPAAASQNGHHDAEVEEKEAAENSGSIDLQVGIFFGKAGTFSIVNQEEGRVRFDPITGIAEEEEPRANRLHRRDTPHHLKNKRIQSAGSDREQVAQILAQVLVQILHPLFVDSMTCHYIFSTFIVSFSFFPFII